MFNDVIMLYFLTGFQIVGTFLYGGSLVVCIYKWNKLLKYKDKGFKLNTPQITLFLMLLGSSLRLIFMIDPFGKHGFIISIMKSCKSLL